MDLAEKNRLDFQKKTEELTGEIAIGSGELRSFSHLAVLLTDFHKYSAMNGLKKEKSMKKFLACLMAAVSVLTISAARAEEESMRIRLTVGDEVLYVDLEDKF